MQIYLLRHGEYLQYDPEQKLSVKGEKQIQSVGKMFKKAGIKFDLILSSTKKRSIQTAAIIAEATEYHASEIVETPLVKPNTPPEDTLDFLQMHTDKKSILIAGHLPSVGELLSGLLTDRAQVHSIFETGTVCRVDVDTLPCTEGVLRWFITGSVLDILVS